MTRTILPKETSLRRELECYVVSCNKYLRKAVKSMDFITLLRNAHPAYRPDFARDLRKAETISEEASKEFIKIR